MKHFKRILFTETKQELEYSLENSKDLIEQIDNFLLQD